MNKKMLAGMEKSGSFHQKREALIEKIYDADEIGQRILNGDGGSWIKETYDPETIYQLDRFHIYKEIKKKIRDGVAQDQIREMLEQKKVDEMLEYIQIYADSIESDDAKDKGSEKARELIDTIERYTDGLIFTMQMEEIIQTLSAAKAPKKDGKGNPYVEAITHHMPLLDAMRTASRKAFERAFC